MNYHEEEVIFMSVFYGKNRWHELLKEILDIIKPLPDDTVLNSLFVYLSTSRGENIRIAFMCHVDDPEFSKMEQKLCAYLSGSPSLQREIDLPVTQFFKNYQPNQIRYNLFNHRSLIPPELRSFQLVLSRILLIYFKNRAITDESIFALVFILHQRLVDALFDTAEQKAAFCSEMLDEILNKVLLYPENLESNWPWVLPGQAMYPLSRTFLLDNLLQSFQDNVTWYLRQILSPVEVYCHVLRIISLHIDRLPQVYFINVLHKTLSSVHDFSGKI